VWQAFAMAGRLIEPGWGMKEQPFAIGFRGQGPTADPLFVHDVSRLGIRHGQIVGRRGGGQANDEGDSNDQA
jgi:hypothetical protein